MSDKKRKVITGKEPKPKMDTDALSNFKERLTESILGTQKDAVGQSQAMAETEKPLDYYNTTSKEKDANGDWTLTVTDSLRGPKTNIDDQTTKLHDQRKSDFQHTPIHGGQTPVELDSRQKRQASTQKLLGDYKQAKRQSAFRGNMAGIHAATLGLSKPAAAQAYLQGKKNYINEPVEAIEGGIAASRDMNKVEGQNIELAAQDELDDPKSQVSRQLRNNLNKEFGMNLPETVNGRAIQQLFPQIKVDTQRDTTVRGQNHTFKTKEEDRRSRESQGSKNRHSKEGIADENRKAGIGKVIIGGALAQDAATRKGASDSVQKTANSATLPDSFSGNSFLVTKKGIPPSPERAKEIQTLGVEAARYVSVLKQIQGLITQAQGRPQFFDENWPVVKAKYAEASQRNVKFNGNGVTNGPDLEQALRQIGDPADAVNWLRGAGKQIIESASKSAMDQYYIGADAAGFEKSNKPSQTTQTLGTGGSSSTQKPVNPALADGANAAAERFGFDPIVAPPSPASAEPGVKKSTFRFVPGKGFVKVGE